MSNRNTMPPWPPEKPQLALFNGKSPIELRPVFHRLIQIYFPFPLWIEHYKVMRPVSIIVVLFCKIKAKFPNYKVDCLIIIIYVNYHCITAIKISNWKTCVQHSAKLQEKAANIDRKNHLNNMTFATIHSYTWTIKSWIVCGRTQKNKVLTSSQNSSLNNFGHLN